MQVSELPPLQIAWSPVLRVTPNLASISRWRRLSPSFGCLPIGMYSPRTDTYASDSPMSSRRSRDVILNRICWGKSLTASESKWNIRLPCIFITIIIVSSSSSSTTTYPQAVSRHYTLRIASARPWLNRLEAIFNDRQMTRPCLC